MDTALQNIVERVRQAASAGTLLRLRSTMFCRAVSIPPMLTG